MRLSARAIDFLYRKRLEQTKLFKNSTVKNKNWAFCEIFVPTELMNGGFICEELNEERGMFTPHVYLNDERIFLKPDNHLYHPVKSVKTEILRMQNLMTTCFFISEKIF